MNLLSYILLLIVASVGCCHEASSDEAMIHQCINDKVQPSFDNMLHISEDSLSSPRSSTKGKRPKRETNGGMENMRLHTVYHSSTADKSFFTSPTGLFRKATNFFSKAFLVKPRKSRLTLQPKCSETITSGANAGKCKKIDKGNMNCGPFSIPANLKGAGVECKKKSGKCKSKGSSGTGVNTDFILFTGAMDSECALYGSSVLAFAAVCGIDDTNQRPSVGFINICYKNILNSVGSVNDDIVYNILLHEMSHAFGFTSTAMSTLFRNQQGVQYNPVSQFRFNGKLIPGLTSPKVLQYAREYYNCPSLKYMPLEDGGGSGSASSHWEARVLYHEMLMPFLSPDYMVFSNFTWAFFEDSGWYKVDYSYTNSINSLEMKWGKGLGCNFVTRPCTDKTSFPYSCEAHGCTFDRISKGVCRSFSQFFDGCKIILPQSSGSCIHNGKKLSKIDEVFGKTSRCFEYQSSLVGSGSSLACLNTSVVHHPNSGVTAYKIESGSSSEWCEEGERKLIDGHLVRCPVIEDITIQYTNIQSINTVPRQLCHSGCMDCTEPYKSSQCTSCHDGFILDGPTPNSCCNPQQSGSCKSVSTCTNGDVRLVGGDSQYEGNIQTCVNGEWGSVCHNNWHSLEAFVVCKQLGYSLIGAKPTCCSRFRNIPRLPFVKDRLRCTGKEDMLADCSHDNSQISRCNGATVAGVQCPAPCKNGDTKIVSYYGTDGFVNGRPSICHESVFKPICDFGWNDETASLFCKEHGYSQYGVISSRGNTLYSSLIEATKSVYVTSCEGKSQFADCQLGTTKNCPRSIAGVVCQPANTVADGCVHGDIRLVGGGNSAEGRLEVCVNSIWGTVCGSYSWGANEATVACKQLGYSDGSVVSSSDFPFGKGSGPVLLNFVNCTGSKKRLIDCSNHYYSYCASPALVSCR